jgi:hypothetical protein
MEGRTRGMSRFALLTLLLTGGLAQAQSSNGSMILAEGFAAPNAYTGPLPGTFESWCADTEDGSRCIPTVTLDVFDAKKARRLGAVHAWGKDFSSTGSGTVQFKEFILYELKDGQLYTVSQDGGHPGGAFADPSLIIPKHGDVVLLGGAEGLVVGGTGKYSAASGPYSTRLKVETIGGLLAYYDELFFRFRDIDIQ